MLKGAVKKARDSTKQEGGDQELGKSVRLNPVSDMAVNEVLRQQDLVDVDEEKERENKFKNDHVEYLRIARKPLQFGIEEELCYTQHQHMHIQGVIQNFNNKVFGTWDLKSLHLWDMETGARLQIKKMIDVTHTHCTISAVAFSHRFRLYLVITSQFKFIFLNELCYVVTMLDMSELSTVNFVYFNDKQKQLVTAGNKGVNILNFVYSSKYEAKVAASFDIKGKYISIEFMKKRLLEPIVPWIKGMKIDQKSGIIITWSQGKLPGASKGPNKLGNAAAVCFNKASVCFNWLNSRPPNGNDNGAREEEEVDEAIMNKAIDAVRKLITSQKASDGIVEGNNEVIKCMEDKTTLCVVLAADITDLKFKKNFMAKAATCNTNVIEIGTRDDLGAWLGHCKYDKQKKPIKIQPVTLFALKDYGDEFESYQIVRSFIKQQKVMRQNKTGDLIALFKDIMDFGEQILDVLVFIDYRYFLISTDEGNIYVYKYVQSGKIETQKRLIHTYSGHNKNITHLDKMENFPHLFMSTSLDGTARVWSLETFMHLYTIEIPGTLSFSNILNKCQQILCQSHNEVKVYKVHMILENYMNSESQVLQVTPSYHTIPDRENGKVGFTISVCQDNSAVIKDVNEALASFEKTTLYPPPSAQTIKKIVYSTSLDRLILLLSSSTICIYKRVKETALLEKILDPSEIKDCEMKRAFSQQVTCMEIINTESANQILPFDTEVINLRMHEGVLQQALNDPAEKREFIVLGLSKGAVLLFHVSQLNQLYCRFTVHREKIKIIKYLPQTNIFLSICNEGNIIFWQVGQDRKVVKLRQFKVPAEKKVSRVHIIAPSYYRHRHDVLCDRIMLVFKSGESEIFDFELGEVQYLEEGEEQNLMNAHLYLLENEKQKEHDSKITGVDSSQYVRLIVTSDISGNIKIWSLEKRFMREIQFPHPIDSVCFINERGDILVSHVSRISKIKFETYWTGSFTNFGFTKLNDPIHQNYKRKEATIETEMYDDHVFLKPPPSRTRIIDNDHFEELFRTKSEDEMQQSKSTLSKVDIMTNTLKVSTLAKAGQEAILKGMTSHRKQSGFAVSDQASSTMEVNQIKSRLGDSALRKMQQSVNPFASQQDLSQRSSQQHFKAAINPLGATSYLSKISAPGSQLDRAQQMQAQGASKFKGKGASSQQPVKRELRVKRNSSLTLFQLEEKQKQHERERVNDEQKAYEEKIKRLNGPGCQDAVPRERNPFAQKQVLQPLPGISYLSTSPVYYEMLANRKKKGQLKGLTRRKITENRISGNIMNFNSPTAVNDFSDMELSVDYHTQVAQHKYNQSNFLPLMNLQILSKIPIEQILNPNLDSSENGTQNYGKLDGADQINMSAHSRKSRSNIPFRTNSFGGDDRQSRNTNRSGKETAASHVTHGSNRHSLVKPIGLEGPQQLHAMLQPNAQQQQIPDQSNGRNIARSNQRTNIIMTGNQIVGGNLNFPKTTRNAPNQIVLNSQQQRSPAEDGTSMSAFDHSLIIEGKNKVRSNNVEGSQITDISNNGAAISSMIGSDKPKEMGDESQVNHNNTTNQQVSQNTQDTSKQVFGNKSGLMISPGGAGRGVATGAGKITEISTQGRELASIKEDAGMASQGRNASYINQNLPEQLGLVQDDSIIENDQPSVMLPKGRQAVNDYRGQNSPEKNMNLTGDSFADSIMSNHYQNK